MNRQKSSSRYMRYEFTKYSLYCVEMFIIDSIYHADRLLCTKEVKQTIHLRLDTNLLEIGATLANSRFSSTRGSQGIDVQRSNIISGAGYQKKAQTIK